MAATEDSDIPETGAVFTFGKSAFADNLPNKFWVKNDRVTQVACGDEHTALIVESGRVFMFGPNDWGQLGLGRDIKPGVNKPSCIKSLKHEKSRLVACGRSHTIISTESGHIYSCGSNSEGQLGIIDVTDLYTPRRIESLKPTSYKMLSAGSDSSVALTEDGRVFVWGGNEDGKLGLGEEVQNAYEPELLSFDCPVVCIACGYYHTAVVTDDGKLYTMGEAEGGKLGLPEDIENTKVPHQVTAIPDPVKWVACGSSHTVALTEFGECYVFGEGENGQLGLGTEILSTSTPTHLQLPFKVARVFCGQNFTALISEKGQLYTFGDGRHGKLAHGSDQYSNLHKPVHSKRFCHFIVDRAACGGCHMIVTARIKVPDGQVESDEEADELKSFENNLSPYINKSDGSPSLTRSLSARERRRNELQKSFSDLNHTLPALVSHKGPSSLSATMPVLTSSKPKINGHPLNKTMVPKIEVIPNGNTPHDESSEASQDEEENNNEEKKTANHTPPKVSPRRKLPGSQDLSQLEYCSDGDDEDDSESKQEVSHRSKKFLEKEEEEESSEEGEDNEKDVLKLASELGNKVDLVVEKTDIEEQEDVSVKEAVDNKVKEETDLFNGQPYKEQQPQIPVVAPRKKKEMNAKLEEDEEDDSEEEEKGKKHKDEEEEKDHSKEKEKQKKEKKGVEEKKEKGKKEKKKSKKDNEEVDEEENDKKAKSKNDKKNKSKDKKRKKDEVQDGDEEEEDDETDKKKDKIKKKDKKKENDSDNKKKKKSIKVRDKKEEDEETSDKEVKGKTKDENKDKKGEEKDEDKKTDKKKNKEEISGEKDKNQSNITRPLKRSRLCAIL